MRFSKGHLPVETSPRQATASSSDHLPETTRYQPTQGAKTDWLYEGPRTRFSHRQTVPSTLKNIDYLPMDALLLKKGNICALTMEPISPMILSEPSDSL